MKAARSERQFKKVLEASNLYLEVGAGSERSLDAAETLNDDITSRRSAADAANPGTLQIYAQRPLHFLLMTCDHKSLNTAQGKKSWISSRYEINGGQQTSHKRIRTEALSRFPLPLRRKHDERRRSSFQAFREEALQSKKAERSARRIPSGHSRREGEGPGGRGKQTRMTEPHPFI